MNINVLRQYLDLYDQQNMGAPRHVRVPNQDIGLASVYDPSGRESDKRRIWAERMATLQAQAQQTQQTPPDFFQGQPPDSFQADQGQMMPMMPRERYDDEGLPEGRNYGAQLERARMRGRGMGMQDDRGAPVRNYLKRLLGA